MAGMESGASGLERNPEFEPRSAVLDAGSDDHRALGRAALDSVGVVEPDAAAAREDVAHDLGNTAIKNY